MDAKELGKLFDELTTVGNRISALLNKGIDNGEPVARLNKLREAAALVGSARAEVYHLENVVRQSERFDQIVADGG